MKKVLKEPSHDFTPEKIVMAFEERKLRLVIFNKEKRKGVSTAKLFLV